MYITFGVTEIIVDDHFDHVDIKASRSDLGTDKNLNLILFKPFQSNNPLHLTHITMETLNLFPDLL